MSNLFDSAEIVFRYTRRMAIADGVLVDATQGEFAEVSREHFPDRHLAMTSAVFALLETHADAEGLAPLWDQVLRMAHIRQVRLFPGGHTFQIALGCRRAPRWRTLQIQFHTAANGEPCATVRLAGD